MAEAKENQSSDTLETVFSAIESGCCPGSSYKPEKKPDTLDYVFDNVESFTCRNEEKEPEVNYNDMLAIERDNSIVIFDEQGRPLTESVTRSMRKTGNDKDALDYVFENVERYACNEAMPDDQHVLRKAMLPSIGVTGIHRGYHHNPKVFGEESQDDNEIQLFFRPKKGSSKKERRRRRRQKK